MVALLLGLAAVGAQESRSHQIAAQFSNWLLIIASVNPGGEHRCLVAAVQYRRKVTWLVKPTG